MDGEDATAAIRSREVQRGRLPGLDPRPSAARWWRGAGLGRAGWRVLDGRDIATAVFPDADVKFYGAADTGRGSCAGRGARGRRRGFSAWRPRGRDPGARPMDSTRQARPHPRPGSRAPRPHDVPDAGRSPARMLETVEPTGVSPEPWQAPQGTLSSRPARSTSGAPPWIPRPEGSRPSSDPLGRRGAPARAAALESQRSALRGGPGPAPAAAARYRGHGASAVRFVYGPHGKPALHQGGGGCASRGAFGERALFAVVPGPRARIDSRASARASITSHRRALLRAG